MYLTPFLTGYVLFITLLLGAVMGSFTACMAGRMAVGESFIRGRSHCDACGHVLGIKELVPVFSWLALKGKCRWCGGRISLRCPLTELLCAGAFVGIVLRYDISLLTLQYLILTIILLAIGLVDYDTGIIPNGFILAMIINWLVFLPFISEGALLQRGFQGLMGGLAASLPLLLLSLVMDQILKRESMGGGDIKLFFAAGLFFSWQEVLFLLILSCLLGLLFAVVTKKTTGDPENPQAFPFGPAIVAAVYLSLLAAEPVMAWYLQLFL